MVREDRKAQETDLEKSSVLAEKKTKRKQNRSQREHPAGPAVVSGAPGPAPQRGSPPPGTRGRRCPRASSGVGSRGLAEARRPPPSRTATVDTGGRDCQKVQENPMRMETPSPENVCTVLRTLDPLSPRVTSGMLPKRKRCRYRTPEVTSASWGSPGGPRHPRSHISQSGRLRTSPAAATTRASPRGRGPKEAAARPWRADSRPAEPLQRTMGAKARTTSDPAPPPTHLQGAQRTRGRGTAAATEHVADLIIR